MITEAHIDDLQIHSIVGGVGTGSFALTRFVGLGTSSPRSNRPPRGRRHGLYEKTTYYDGRALSLEGIVAEDDWDDFWANVDELKQKLALSGVVHELRWKRQGESVANVVEVSVAGEMEIDIPGGRTRPRTKWAVDLIAADPRIYRDDLEDQTFASTATVTNDGNFSTPPVITFHTPGVNPGLRNNSLTTENEINLDYGGGGTSLVVDMLEREITLDGTSRPDLLSLSDSSFWSLVSGANSLQKIGGATSITVEWRAAWN